VTQRRRISLAHDVRIFLPHHLHEKMATVKTLHLIFMVSWFAGLFYLPRLFVYHALATDTIGIERFKVMERRLYRGIMTPSAVLTIVFGVWLWQGYGISGGWLHAKLALVAILIAHHLWLGKLLRDFAADRNTHSDTFFRWINEIPALPLLAGIVYLVVAKPF
jgi:putative membrane protein